MIYFVTFFITSFCAYQGKKGKKFYSVFLIVWMSLLAGLRDYTVGTDVLIYGNNLFESAKQLGFGEFLIRNYNWYGIEPLYSVLTYILSMFASEAHILYFVIEFIIISLVYKRLLKLESPSSVALGMLIFQCLFIGETFNLMRQSIAIAIIFFAMEFVEKKQYVRYLILLLIAMGFHLTAIIGLLFMIINIILNKKDDIWVHILIVSGTFVVTLSYSRVLDFMMQIGLMTNKYMNYITESDQGLDLNIIILRLPILLLIMVYFKNYCKDDKKNSVFLIDILIIEIFLAEFRILSGTLYRISFYFAFFKILAYPKLECVLKNKKNKLIVSIIIICYCLIVFYYQTVIQGNNEIYPYKTYSF